MDIEDIIRDTIKESPDFAEAYINGRKWVADTYYDGDLSKLKPITKDIQEAINESNQP